MSATAVVQNRARSRSLGLADWKMQAKVLLLTLLVVLLSGASLSTYSYLTFRRDTVDRPVRD